jgi:hypothetical protein
MSTPAQWEGRVSSPANKPDYPCQKANDQLFAYPFQLPMMEGAGSLRIGERTRPNLVEDGRERQHYANSQKDDSPVSSKWMFPTRTGGKFLLESRPIATVPFMGSGQTVITDTDVYSRYLVGLDTGNKKANNSLAGISIDRSIPMVPCLAREIQNPEHYIPKYWVRGGMDTRSVTQNIDYMARCRADADACGVNSADNTDPLLKMWNGWGAPTCTNVMGSTYLH